VTTPGSFEEDILETAIASSLGSDADDDFVTALRARLLRVVDNALNHVGQFLEVVPLDPTDALITQFLDGHVPQLVLINHETRLAVRQTVLDGLTRGDSFIRIANEIEPKVGLTRGHAKAVERFRAKLEEAGVRNVKERTERYANQLRQWRARTIADTESGIMWDRAAWLEMRDAGVKGRSWLTSRDEDVRDSHEPMYGQCRGIDEPFVTGAGVELMHPHDSAAPLDEIVNCRCTTVPVPGGCGTKARPLGTEAQRLYYWRVVRLQQERHELTLARAVAQLFSAQGKAFASALRARLRRAA
jgi:hypothetical protein